MNKMFLKLKLNSFSVPKAKNSTNAENKPAVLFFFELGS